MRNQGDTQTSGWEIESIINFDLRFGTLSKNGFAYFGFHDKNGKQYAISHQRHFLGPVDNNDSLKWTVATSSIYEDVPNIHADLKYPMYIDSMPDGTLITSNFGNNRIYRINESKMKAKLFVDGSAIGMKDMGNCVVDNEGCVWVNEVVGCKVWRFDSTGRPILILGNGKPGFQSEEVDFHKVKFNWIDDIRLGPDGNIYVLDSMNFAVRMINIKNNTVSTLAGTGKGGYDGDGGDARLATFGSNPKEHFNGPISMSLDEEGNIFVGDKFNYVVRMIHRKTGIIETIAGNHVSVEGRRNDPKEKDRFRLNLPQISSMDYYNGRLFIPTDLTTDVGDLVVLKSI